MAPLLRVEGLRVHFPVAGAGFREKRVIKAVDGVSFDVADGEVLGVVGESGCGKSTLARALVGLVKATAGSVTFGGENWLELDRRILRSRRRWMQMIFQDPLASLNPCMTVGEIIAEPLTVHGADYPRREVAARVAGWLERVGLGAAQLNRYPHELSGGQCQRVGIARALIMHPKIVICDEPVSALDVSVRAQIVNLLRQLQAELDLALVFIAHDLTVIHHISDRVMVMYLGKVIEIDRSDELFTRPLHPYTRALLEAVPVPDPDIARAKHRAVGKGDPPSPLHPPGGCGYRTRCPLAIERCRLRTPPLRVVSDGSARVACHRVD